MQAGFDDSDWEPATVLMDNAVDSQMHQSGVSENAKWIWTESSVSLSCIIWEMDIFYNKSFIFERLSGAWLNIVE